MKTTSGSFFNTLKSITPTASEIASSGVKYSDYSLTPFGAIYIESRPYEKGRSVLIAQSDKKRLELNPRNTSVRSRVYEYGGKSWAVSKLGVVFCLDNKGLYYLKHDLNSSKCIEQSLENTYFGDPDITDSGMIAAIKEMPRDKKCFITLFDLTTNKSSDFAYGDKLFAYPRLNPSSTKIAFISWSETNMPWQASTLLVGDVVSKNNGITIKNVKTVIKEGSFSVTQPKWINDTTLVFLSDLDGYYNLYQFDCLTSQLTQLTDLKFDCCHPQWVFGQSNFVAINEESFLITFRKVTKTEITWKLGLKEKNRFKEINCEFCYISSLSIYKDKIGALISKNNQPLAPAYFTVKEILHGLNNESLKPKMIIKPKKKFNKLTWSVIGIKVNDAPVKALFYKAQKSFSGLNPLIMICHGGPTSSIEPGYDPTIDFFTSKGFNVVSFDYRGSSGYGRQFRNLLKGNWGLSDVEDAIALAQYLIEKKLVSASKLFIRGSSAGGLTVFGALAKSSLFAGGVSYYGVTDLFKLDQSTHRFESNYLSWLIGPLPKAKKLFKERSPINFAHEIKSPMLIFQGLQDNVVPVDQAETIFNKLRENKTLVKLILFKDEGHGFRAQSAIKRSLEEELKFYIRLGAFD